ncbi:MAG: glycosyltransferase [Clostridia bacterium]|nr:glycosyltransferase [Clostridia bacterium]
MDTVVLLPAYNPNIMMLTSLRELKKEGFGILVVNDGSAKEFSELFEEAKKYAVVLCYEKNMGKGYALKYGMQKIREHFPDAQRFITADADGQHSTEDIVNIREKMRSGDDFILGTRDFKGNTPLRSRVGNSMSRFVFAVSTGYYLSDNQSGLRGFDMCHVPWMVKVGGNRYEYEMNVLICAVKQRIKICTVPIKTIYIDDNRSSHFNPVRDTLRIHKNMFFGAGGSLISVFLSIILVSLIDIFYGFEMWPLRLYAVGMLSIILSWVLNRFVWYREFSFRGDKRLVFSAILRWILYILVILSIHTVLPSVPLTICFLVTVFLVMVGEYFTRKFTAHS